MKSIDIAAQLRNLGLTKALARALLIVIAFGVFGLLVHKPRETENFSNLLYWAPPC